MHLDAIGPFQQDVFQGLITIWFLFKICLRMRTSLGSLIILMLSIRFIC